MSEQLPTLPCTVCQWFKRVTPATWRVLSPSHTWHYLCEQDFALYSHRYTQPHRLTSDLIQAITTTGTPFGKDRS